MRFLSALRKFLRGNYILALIVVFAAFLRFVGTNPGYPPIHTDEGITHYQGLSIILNRTLDPVHNNTVNRFDYLVYPITVPLVNAIFYLFIFIPAYSLIYFISHFKEVSLLAPLGIEQIWKIISINIFGSSNINVVFWGRYVTALFGTGVVVMGYLVAKRLFSSKTVGLLASFFIAVNYRQVLNSHIGIPDIYNAFFLLFALYQIIKLWEKQTTTRYTSAGVSVALFFSTKFQFFALPPLALVLIFLAWNKKGISKKVMFFFQKNIILMVGLMIFTVIILNLFHIIRIREVLEQLGYVALKYRYGKSALDFYPISYLYHIGIGPVMSFVVLGGIILGLLFRFSRMFLLLSVIIPFMWMFVYYTGGGFYTRNFVTIIPLLLICAAFGLHATLERLRSVSKIFPFILGGAFILVISFESLSNSLIVPIEYSKPWNYKLTQQWIGKNIPEGETILSYPGAPIPSKSFKIIEVKTPSDFSLAKMQEEGIQWAVLNTEWIGDEFLWWMNQDTLTSLKFWNKPTGVLSITPLARSIFELKSYIVFEALNPWQAPDNNFLIVNSKKNPTNFNSKFNLNEHLFLNSNGGM